MGTDKTVNRVLRGLSPHLVAGVEGTVLTDEERRLFREIPPAGVIIFARNVKDQQQLRQMTGEIVEIIRDSSGYIPLIMADHEGGRTSVLARAIGTPPSQMALQRGSCNLKSKGICIDVIRETARRMRLCGINMTLAPVADINSEYLNPIIGTRSFGEKEEEVSLYVAEAVRAMNEEGILSSVKHFPGHGSSVGDSHHVLPVIAKNLEQLREKELVPFQKGIEAGADTVMTAHISVAGRSRPASLDSFLIGELLRKESSFKGAVITDGLEMAGILTGRGLVGGAKTAAEELLSRKGPEDDETGERPHPGLLKPAVVTRSAIEAGNDLLLFTRPASVVFDELSTVLSILDEDLDFWNSDFGEISLESLPRITRLREKIEGFGSIQQSPACDGAYLKAAESATAVLRDPGRILPFGKGSIPVPDFVGEKSDFEYYPVERFIDGLLSFAGHKDKAGRLSPERLVSQGEVMIPSSYETTPIFRFSPSGDKSIRGTGPAILVLLNRRPFSPADLRRLSAPYDVIITGERVWAGHLLPPEKTVIASYGTYDEAARVIVRIMSG